MSDPAYGPEIDDRLRAVAEDQPAFAGTIGSRLVSVERDRVVAELLVTERHGNRNGVLHGGAVMAFADNLGGTACSMNLPEGAWTVRIRSGPRVCGLEWKVELAELGNELA